MVARVGGATKPHGGHCSAVLLQRRGCRCDRITGTCCRSVSSSTSGDRRSADAHTAPQQDGHGRHGRHAAEHGGTLEQPRRGGQIARDAATAVGKHLGVSRAGCEKAVQVDMIIGECAEKECSRTCRCERCCYPVDLLRTLERNMSDCASPMASARATSDAARDSDDSASDIDGESICQFSCLAAAGSFSTVLHKNTAQHNQIDSLLESLNQILGIGDRQASEGCSRISVFQYVEHNQKKVMT